MDLKILLKIKACADTQQRPLHVDFFFKLGIIRFFGEIFISSTKPWAGKHVHMEEVSFGAGGSFAIGFCGSRPWFSAISQSDINMQVRMGERERWREKCWIQKDSLAVRCLIT